VASRLCTIILFITYFRTILPLAVCIVIVIYYGIRVLLREPRGAKANVISALLEYKFHARETIDQVNKEDDDVRVSIGGDP